MYTEPKEVGVARLVFVRSIPMTFLGSHDTGTTDFPRDYDKLWTMSPHK